MKYRLCEFKEEIKVGEVIELPEDAVVLCVEMHRYETYIKYLLPLDTKTYTGVTSQKDKVWKNLQEAEEVYEKAQETYMDYIGHV